MTELFEYILHNFRLYYKYDEGIVGYGEESACRVLVSRKVPESFFSGSADIDPGNIVWKTWKGMELPFCFDKDPDKEIISEASGRLIINYDIIGSAFYFLSGWNEYINPSRDQFGRVPYANSMIEQLKIARIPVVNYYFDILASAISRVSKIENISHWKDREFAVALTHDIDKCQTGWIEASANALKQGRFFSILKLILKKFFAKDEYFNFDLISKIEKEYGAVSSYYFLPKKARSGDLQNADYRISSRKVRNAIESLKRSGNEIGVHGSFGTHTEASNLMLDIKRIPTEPIIGNRFHYLMFDPALTVGVLDTCKIRYDTSLGFAEEIGFRRGTCYPFFLFDLDQMKTTSVLEIPLVCMDVTLQEHKYLGLSPADASLAIREIAAEIKKFSGIFTLLWHNNLFSEYKNKGWKDVYINALNDCREMNGLLTSGKEIYERITR